MDRDKQTRESRAVVTRFFEKIVIHQLPFIAYCGSYSGREAFPALAAKFNKDLDMAASKLQLPVPDGDTVFAAHLAPEVKTGKI